jgi:hypothetical protein
MSQNWIFLLFFKFGEGSPVSVKHALRSIYGLKSLDHALVLFTRLGCQPNEEKFRHYPGIELSIFGVTLVALTHLGLRPLQQQLLENSETMGTLLQFNSKQ